ncbi:MAG: hypothetical protein KC503_43975, partial [Myxococcales bacterium]|nr:hypothetical protein [Myxococcales bacterium]
GGGADIYIDAAPKKDAGAKPSAPLAAAVDAAGGGGGGGGEPAVRVERPSGRPGAAAAPAAPRRRRRTARRHRERVVAKRPPVARGVLSPVKLARMLRSCRTAYVNAKYLVALRRARAILHWQPSNQEAWQVIGASACMLRQGALVRLSLKHLGGSARNLIRSVCQRAGLTP